jgi:hypothetical protein
VTDSVVQSRPARDEHAVTAGPCPACGAAAELPLFSLPRIPVTCAGVFDSRGAARAVAHGRLDLAACRVCALARNLSFDDALAEFGARYDSSQSASAHFSRYTAALAAQWVGAYVLDGSTVLEVGCGDTAFAAALRAQGVARVIGIDPLAPPAAGNGIELRHEPLGAHHTQIDARALICRHTLEHVASPLRFLELVRRWGAAGPERVVLFEVPAAERIARESAFWDVYYEHYTYFTAASAARLLARAGFELTRVATEYDDQYLLIEARAATAAVTASTPPPADELSLWRDFAAGSERGIARARARIAAMRADGAPLVLWQGACKTVGFLSALALDDAFACAVDLSPARHGRYLPGSGLQVLAPEALRRMQPRHVVLMNAAYLDEVRAHLAALGVTATVTTVNALCGDDAALHTVIHSTATPSV